MPQFFVYQNKNPASKKAYPYFVDTQSALLDGLHTTVVIPLCSLSSMGDKPIAKLCPIVEIHGKKYIALTQLLAGIDRKLLGPEIANLSAYRSEFTAAMDFVISGI